MNQKPGTQKPREGLREQKKRLSRDAMHRAALELVAAHGTAQVTVDQIAEAACVSPRTLFNYWGSKEAVILGIGPGDHESLLTFLKERPEGEELSVSMRALLTLHLTHATPDRSIRTLKRNVLRREPHLAQTLTNQLNDVQRRLIEILAERLTPELGEDLAHDTASMYVFWAFAMSRAAYAISMRRDIDLLDALELVFTHLDDGVIPNYLPHISSEGPHHG